MTASLGGEAAAPRSPGTHGDDEVPDDDDVLGDDYDGDGEDEDLLPVTRRDKVLLHSVLRREINKQLSGCRRRDNERGTPWPGRGDRGLTRLQSTWELYAEIGERLRGGSEEEERCLEQQAAKFADVTAYISGVARWRLENGLATWFVWREMAPGVWLGSDEERAAERERMRPAPAGR